MPVLVQRKNLLCFFNLLYLKEIDAVQRGGFFGMKGGNNKERHFSPLLYNFDVLILFVCYSVCQLPN